jgi:hypothetical protein
MVSGYQRAINRRVSIISEYLEFAKECDDALRAFANVNRVDVGWRVRGGVHVNELAVRLHISGKKKRSSSFERLAPPVVHGVPIDIISMSSPPSMETGSPDPRRVIAYSRLVGGISFGGLKTGTLGLVVETNRFGMCALTARHLGEFEGTVFYQPALRDSEHIPRRVGVVVDGLPALDVIIVALEEEGALGSILEIGTVREFASASFVTELCASKRVVTKSGRSSGVTRGIVASLSPLGRLTIRTRDGRAGELLSCPGDSGAVWTTLDGVVVGVHVEGEAIGYPEEATAYLLEEPVAQWGLQFGRS